MTKSIHHHTYVIDALRMVLPVRVKYGRLFGGSGHRTNFGVDSTAAYEQRMRGAIGQLQLPSMTAGATRMHEP